MVPPTSSELDRDDLSESVTKSPPAGPGQRLARPEAVSSDSDDIVGPVTEWRRAEGSGPAA